MSKRQNLTEKKISSEIIYDGELLHVNKDIVELPDGNTSVREWIKHPGASAILPVYENGDVMLIRQFRYPPRIEFLEVPAGKIDAGEAHEITARRELKEETGLECEHLECVGNFYPAIGYTDEIIHLYVAWGLKQQNENSDFDEFVEPLRIPFHKAMKMIESGEITDGKTMACLFRAYFWWKRNAPFEVNLGD